MLKRSIFSVKPIVLDISWDYAVCALCRVLATEVELNKKQYQSLAMELERDHGKRSALFYAAYCLQEPLTAQSTPTDPELAKLATRRKLQAKAYISIHRAEADKYYRTSPTAKQLFTNIAGYCTCVPRHTKTDGEGACPSFN